MQLVLQQCKTLLNIMWWPNKRYR